MIADDGWPTCPPGPYVGLRWRETDRWEWRVTDGGDPWLSAQEWLESRGFPVMDMSSNRHVDTAGEPRRGAVLLLGADASSVALGHGPGPRSPVPGIPDVAVVVVEEVAGVVPARGRGPARAWVPEWLDAWSVQRHEAAVQEVRERIAAGDVYQVNLVGCWTGQVAGEAGHLARRVLDLPGATWRGAVGGAGWAVGCASPESLLSVRDGMVASRPVKGTLPVGGDPTASRARLVDSAKDRAEHVMIVDLVRNDLARVAEVGSVLVPELYDVQQWAGLWHAHSTVTGRVRQGTGLADVLRAVLPGGSVTGAPKLAALEVIAELEPAGRGPSMGALGWLDAASGLELALTIRTVAVDATGAGEPVAAVWAGGGITWGSEARAERAEAEAKAGPLLELLSRR